MMAVLKRVVTPAVVLVLALPAANAFAAPLDNDDYQDATHLDFFQRVLPTTDRTNTGAGFQNLEPLTLGESNPQHGCAQTATPRRLSHTIWYEVPGDGDPVTVHTRGSTVDTVIAVYDTDAAPGSAPPSINETPNTFFGCNDNIDGTDNRASEVTFPTENGFNYLVQVGGCLGCGAAEQGGIEFVAYNTPVNDDRASAARINAGAPTAGDNFGATVETNLNERATCGAIPFAKTVWFRYSATGNGKAVFTTSGIDTVLSVYRGTTFLGCNDDGPGQSTASRVEVVGVTPGDYFIQVGGYGAGRQADFGDINVQAEFTPAVVPPPDRDRDGIPDSSDRCPDQNSAARDANRDGCLDPDLDPDRDGVLVPADKCPTESATGRDTNHDGCLDQLPRKRITADASLGVQPSGNGVKVNWLRVQAPKGAKVTVRCGRRCKFAKRASAADHKQVAVISKTVAIKKLVGRKFRYGQKIRIYVTRKGQIGQYIQYTIVRGPLKKIKRCLNPGSTKPRKRCR